MGARCLFEPRIRLRVNEKKVDPGQWSLDEAFRKKFFIQMPNYENIR